MAKQKQKEMEMQRQREEAEKRRREEGSLKQIQMSILSTNTRFSL
jgi:hypothetical protein